MTAIAITQTELGAPELRAASTRTKDARAARRMLALALVLEGVDRTTAAETCGMDRQTLRDWVHRYNAEGLAGLSNRRASSRPRAPARYCNLTSGNSFEVRAVSPCWGAPQQGLPILVFHGV